MYNCFCGKAFKDRRGLSIHLLRIEKLNELKREKILLEIIYGKENLKKYIKEYKNEVECVWTFKQQGIDITKYITLLGIKRTSSEERKTKRYQEKYTKSIIAKYGVDNISKSKEIKKKKIETVFKNHGVTHNFRKPETIKKAKEAYDLKQADPEYKKEWLKKYKNTCIEKYGVDNVSKDKTIRKKIKETNKLRLSLMTLEQKQKMTEKARAFWNKQNSWESKIEIRVKQLLNSIGIKYQEHVTLYNFNYDIVIGDIIIEINGDFWHANPRKYRPGDKLFPTLTVEEIWEKDVRKTKVAQENKKKVYILWEDDIMNSSDEQLIRTLKEWII